jgi:hypothetical protein
VSLLAVLGATSALLAACGTTVPTSVQAGTGALEQNAGATNPLFQPGQSSGAVHAPTATDGGIVAGPRSDGPSTVSSASSLSTAVARTRAERTSIPKSGPGWDEGHVYVGVVTVTDAPTVGHLLGVNSLDYGDQNSYLKAVFDYVNKNGGLFGRTLVAVPYDASSTTDPNTTAQAACTKFSQDRRVVASLSALPSPTFYSCMRAAGVPVIGDGYGFFFRAKDFEKYKGWLYFWGSPSFERLIPLWLDRLRTMGYFSGWNNTAGAPGNLPVKVGLLYGDDGFRAKAFAYLKTLLKSRGINVAAEFQSSSPSDYSNAVVKFRSAGVTHLFMDSGASLFYPPQAENQHYYARYAVTSNNFIQPFLQETQPKAQLRGMMGVGWIPHQDVDLRHNPGPTAGQAACFKIMREAGASLAKDNYQYVAETVCDSIFLFLEMAHVGGALDPTSLLRSVQAAGSTFPWASQLGRGIVSTDLTLTPVVRGLQYVDSCSCVQYVGPVLRVP